MMSKEGCTKDSFKSFFWMFTNIGADNAGGGGGGGARASFWEMVRGGG